MFSLSRALLDRTIDRRVFLARHPDIDHVKIAKSYGVEAERVAAPGAVSEALSRCKRAMRAGRPYLVDVKIERRFEGKESDGHDSYFVARGEGRNP